VTAKWPYVVGGALGLGALWFLFRHHTHPALHGLGGASGPIKTIQLDLRKIGVPIQPTGALDDATVQAINGIFAGSVDVPPKLATGSLTKHDIAANLGAVQRALKVVVHGAQNFEDVSSG
jgi:hypothetical protein